MKNILNLLPGRIRKHSALILYAIGLAILAAIFFLAQTGENVPEQTLQEIRQEILQRLSAPRAQDRYTDEERKAILQRLTAPKPKDRYMEEERKEILQGLTAPAQ